MYISLAVLSICIALSVYSAFVWVWVEIVCADLFFPSWNMTGVLIWC